MRNYDEEMKKRIEFIQQTMASASADGIVFANSGGKDCALAGILCKMACDNTLSIILPCTSRRNFEEDKNDALELANKFSIETKIFDLSQIKNQFLDMLSPEINVNEMASANIAPRLRMVTLYAIALSQNRLVAGTGNRSEVYMGYFTKWGDGAYDFNPIADLTVTEVYEFLRFLNAPGCVINKAPSAGLFDGQTDENEMGISYAKIDDYLLNGNATEEDKALILKFHEKSRHKRTAFFSYNNAE